MSSRVTSQIPKIHFNGGRSLHYDLRKENNHTEDSAVSLEERWWKPIVFAATTLSAFVAVLMHGPVWLVLLGPFALISLGRVMRIRSLWH